MTTDYVDLDALAQSRIAGLMDASPRFKAYVGAIVEGFEEVQYALRSIDGLLGIDAQSGVVLDLIGRIVGQPRRLLGAALRSFFGFKVQGPGDFQRSLPYGDRADSTAGGLMAERGGSLTGSADLDDAAYRFALNARIVKNNLRLDGTKSWIERVYEVLLKIFPTANFDAGGGTIIHLYPLWCEARKMSMTISVGKIPSAREVSLLTQADLVPVPNGVGVRYECWDDAQPVFGFAGGGATNLAPYGDRAYPERGGAFAEGMSSNVLD